MGFQGGNQKRLRRASRNHERSVRVKQNRSLRMDDQRNPSDKFGSTEHPKYKTTSHITRITVARHEPQNTCLFSIALLFYQGGDHQEYDRRSYMTRTDRGRGHITHFSQKQLYIPHTNQNTNNQLHKSTSLPYEMDEDITDARPIP